MGQESIIPILSIMLLLGLNIWFSSKEREKLQKEITRLQTFILSGIDERREILSRPIIKTPENKKKQEKDDAYTKALQSRVIRKEDKKNLEFERGLE